MEDHSKYLVFSVIVPAHNEEGYIEATLTHLQALTYPRDKYEIIVVENGSTDATYARAQAYADEHTKILRFPGRGVAYARNKGIEVARADADWLIFLDADSYFEPLVLQDLAAYLMRPEARQYAIGSTSVRPWPATTYARIWFVFYDAVHTMLKQSFASIIVRRSLIAGPLFNEQVEVQEDRRFVELLARKGRFFTFRTNGVYTSTRRFKKDGWIRVFIFHALVGIVPARFQGNFKYALVR